MLRTPVGTVMALAVTRSCEHANGRVVLTHLLERSRRRISTAVRWTTSFSPDDWVKTQLMGLSRDGIDHWA